MVVKNKQHGFSTGLSQFNPNKNSAKCNRNKLKDYEITENPIHGDFIIATAATILLPGICIFLRKT